MNKQKSTSSITYLFSTFIGVIVFVFGCVCVFAYLFLSVSICYCCVCTCAQETKFTCLVFRFLFRVIFLVRASVYCCGFLVKYSFRFIRSICRNWYRLSQHACILVSERKYIKPFKYLYICCANFTPSICAFSKLFTSVFLFCTWLRVLLDEIDANHIFFWF